MNKEINLLRSKKKSYLLENEFLRKFHIGAFSLLGIVAIISILIFILTVTSPTNSLLQEKETASKSLDTMDKKSLQLLLIKKNLKDIEEFLGKRSSLDAVIEFVAAQTPAALTVDFFSVNKKNVTMNLSGESLTSFTDFFTKLTTFGIERKLFERVVLDAFSFDPGNNSYSASLTIVNL